MPIPSPDPNSQKDQTAQNTPDLNLVGARCPMAFVKTRLYLDTKTPGDLVDILFEDTAANEPLVRSIEALGHSVIKCEPFAQNVDTTKSVNSSPTKKLQVITVEIQV